MNDIERLLEAYLTPVENERFVATKRWKDKEGNPIIWEIKAVSEDRIKALRLEATRRAQAGYLRSSKLYGGHRTSEVDEIETVVARTDQVHIFNELLAAESTVFPDLSNGALQDKFGTRDEVGLLKAILSVSGELMDYIQRTTAINGFLDKEYKEVYEEAKND